MADERKILLNRVGFWLCQLAAAGDFCVDAEEGFWVDAVAGVALLLDENAEGVGSVVS